MPTDKKRAFFTGLILGDALGTVTASLSLHQIYQKYGELGVEIPPLPITLSEQTKTVLQQFQNMEQSSPDDIGLQVDNLIMCLFLGFILHGNQTKLHETLTKLQLPASRAASYLATAYLVMLALDDIDPANYLSKVWEFCSGMSDEFDFTLRKIGHVLGWGSEIHALRHLGKGEADEEIITIALYCVMRYPNDYLAAVRRAANTDGKSNIIAGITGAIMATRLGVDAIPLTWQNQLQIRKYILK